MIAIATSNIIAGSDSPGSQKLENKVKQFNKWNKGGLELELPT